MASELSEALKRDFAQALADLSAYWGREKNYSWTITPGQQADIVALLQPLLDAVEGVPELKRALGQESDAHQGTRERLQATLDIAGSLISNLDDAREEIGRLQSLRDEGE